MAFKSIAYQIDKFCGFLFVSSGESVEIVRETMTQISLGINYAQFNLL
jgi:hypothetical protein